MIASEKTTYQDLSSSRAAGVNALLNGVSAEEKAALFQSSAITDEQIAHQGTPAIGQYWPGEGGYYAGIMRDGDRQWHLILADKTLGYLESEWGTYGQTIPGEFSRRDGRHNTALILAAEPDNNIAAHFTALLIDDHKDFYWPSQCENNLLFCNLPEHLSNELHWASIPYSALNAWSQNFEDGYHYIRSNYELIAARAVRRLPI